ncbi:MAG: hypothetical protein AAGJ52_08665 [Pseudomonadota bacterium]
MHDDLDLQTPPDRPRYGLNGLSLVAIGLSIAALFISVMEVLAVKDEQRAEVWPYLEVSQSYSQDGYALKVTNKGIGPARVRSASLLLDGEPVNDLNRAILETLGPENAFGYDTYFSSNPAPGVMSPDEEVTIFGVPWNDRTRLLTEAWNGRAQVEVCFCSVYDECWKTSLNQGDPTPVDRCEA